MRQVNTYEPDIKAEPNPKKRQLLRVAKNLVKNEIRDFERRRDTDILELATKQGL